MAFSRLLSNPFDETCLERCYIWYNGEQHPDLCSRVEIDSADKEQEEEMKDNEMVSSFDLQAFRFRLNQFFYRLKLM